MLMLVNLITDADEDAYANGNTDTNAHVHANAKAYSDYDMGGGGAGVHSISSPLHSQRHAKNFIYLDRWVYANSADSDQTAPAEQSDQVLHCLLFHLHPLSKLLHGMNEPFV